MKNQMNRRTFIRTVPALAVLAGAASGSAQDLQPITLPKPETDGGKSVLAALRERRTIRNIRPEKLPPRVLSNLLWAAFGVNREQGMLSACLAVKKPILYIGMGQEYKDIELFDANKFVKDLMEGG